ncbi:Heat-labile enterotoxin, A chain [Cordyceps fumosorosea ARSEF 2679]|uniref:Heat-labile enterotoxin, A chain n=1 Tax=Cordyceps fumosorosea (strain ARSEF 2679) TaxID=1081104 RepID=A0A167R3N7_CORFA|nr:Heat-labile enterotoxin, A chain [Cordyceps fumosorosea ARSEF 2679]OAA58242.1 Heat-labile enterotoxin, A chain [Cordyceps fumosorosea ARSEF 2679]
MHLPSLTACVLLLSSGATALRHGEQDNGVVQALWEAPHVAAHHQRRDGFIIADGKRISRRTHAKLHARQPPPPPPPAPGPPPPPPPGGGAGSSWKDKPSAPSHVEIKVGDLWRGETFRKPEDVRKAGGFESHAKRIFEGTHPDYKTGMTQEAFKMGSSVYHHSKKTCSCSSYVSMSASKDEATNFASKQTAEKTYVYKIRPETNKVVDVAGSLGGDRHLTWTKEKEIAGVYEVPWKQVLGWHEGTPTKAEGGGSEIVFSEFINKGDVYPDDPLPEEVPLTGEFEIRSELAGFPEGHLGRKESPWKKFNDVPVEGWLNEYMLERTFNKDKAKFKEARKGEEWANLPCSSPKRKRAGAPAGCDRVNKQGVEGEEIAKPGNGEGEETAKPDNVEDGLGLDGEKAPGSGSGSDVAELPEITEKWATTAEEISKREFTDLATSRGLAKVAKEKFSQTLTELRGKWLGYTALTKTSPKFKTIYGIAGKLAKPLEKIGTPLWVFGVVDAFARDASALEKAAAITALIPFVGCTVDAAAKGSKGKISPLDTTLCYLADGLMFTPLWPAALVIQAVRAIINAFIPPDVPSPEKLHEKRDKEWRNFLDNTIYTYIYSDEFATPEKTFREKMNSTFVAEAALVISDMADSIGVTNATGQSAMEAEKDAGRKATILNGTQTAIAELRAGVDTEIRRRQRKAVLELPEKLTTSSGVSLKPLAKTFQDEYIANLQSAEFKKKYTDILKINAADVEDKVNKAVTYIQPKAVALPTLFDVAYVVGQSKALEDIDPNALSAREFIMDNTKNLTENKVNIYALHHTLQIAKLLRGALDGGEGALDTRWPTSDTAPTRPLQLLIAMRYGRIYEENKMAWIRKERKGVLGLFAGANDPGEIHWASHPNIPPVKAPKAENEKLSYLGIILGLSEEIVRNTPRGVQPFGFKDLAQNADLLLALLKLDVHATANKQSGAAGKAEDEKPKMMRL